MLCHLILQYLVGNGVAERMVSLGVDLHHQLVTATVARGPMRFEGFADCCEDAEVAVHDFPDLVDITLSN